MILVYQMAKVASRSWVEAAKSTGSTVYHVHFATKRNLQIIADALSVPPERQTIANMLMPRNMLRTGAEVCRQIEAAKGGGAEPVRVITGMRDPVARSISLFMFMADFYGHVSRPLNPRTQLAPDYVVSALQDVWRSVYSDETPGETFEWLAWFLVSVFRFWFEQELNGALGLDIYSKPFNAEDGAVILNASTASALAYRVEDLSPASVGHQMLLRHAQTFLGVPIRKVSNVNTSATRRTNLLYREVLGRFNLPEQLLDRIYAEPVVRHFYSASEIAAFKARWSNVRNGDAPPAGASSPPRP